MSHLPYLLQVLQGLLTPVIALIALYIGYQQWQANKLKLVMDRFDRRWPIYQAVIDFIVAVCRDFKVTADDLSKFRASTIQAEFLFGPDISQYIDDLCARSLKLLDAKSKYRSLGQEIPPGYDPVKVVAAITEQEKWFADLLNLRAVNEMFKKYLDISK